MDAEKYSRSITLRCPTCTGSDFAQPDDSEGDATILTCVGCKREISRAELQRENAANIDAHLEEMKEQIVKDVQVEFKKSLQNAFRGSKFIKVK